MSATFELPTGENVLDSSPTVVRVSGEEVAGEPVYGRYGHPSRSHLEQVLASLESCAHCLVFSSGMAAGHAVLQTLARARPRGPHGGRKLFLLRHPKPNQVLTMTILYLVILSVMSCREMREMGVSVSFVSTSDSQNIGSELLDKDTE